MRIGLLASTQAGKTTHLTGLFGILKRFNKNPDYSVNTQFTDPVQIGQLESWFRLLREEKDLEGTKEITLYECKISHYSFFKPEGGKTSQITRVKQEIAIELIDFAGAYLSGANSEEDKSKVDLVKEALSLCDGFIVIVDGNAILEQNEWDSDAILSSDSICNVLDAALELKRKNQTKDIDPSGNAFVYGKTPIAFAVSKFDKLNVKSFAHKLKKGAIKSFVEAEFATIIKERGHEVTTAIFPVHVWNTIKNDQGERLHRGFEPFNLEKPFQFVTFCGLTNAFSEHKRRLEEWDKLSESAKREASGAQAAYHHRASMSFWDKLNKLGSGDLNTQTRKYILDRASSDYYSKLSKKQMTRDHHNATLALSKWILSEELLECFLSDHAQRRFYVSRLSRDELYACFSYRLQEKQWKREIIEQEELL